MTPREEALVALSLVQLDDLIQRVEHHGMELGMLLDSLMSLVERHDREAQSANAACLERQQELWAQLARDHETMLRFEGPLLLSRQFQDRLRQRLEHLRAALTELSALPRLERAATDAEEERERVERLFPFEEERAATAAAFELEHLPAGEPDIEMF